MNKDQPPIKGKPKMLASLDAGRKRGKDDNAQKSKFENFSTQLTRDVDEVWNSGRDAAGD
jgi:hypothetical protein